MTTRASRTTVNERRGSARRTATALGFVLTVVMAAGACSSTTDTIATKSTSAGTSAVTNETTVGTELAGAAEGTTIPKTDGTDLGYGDDTVVPTLVPRPTSSLGGQQGSTTTLGDTPDDPSTPTSSPKSTVTVKASPDNQEFCQTFADFVNDPGPDMSDDSKVLATYKVIFQKLTTLSPPAIAADWQSINAPIQAASDLKAFQTASSNAAFTVATDRISAWTATNCGFDPNKGSSSSSSSSSGSERTGGTAQGIG